MANLKCPVCDTKFTKVEDICPNPECAFSIKEYTKTFEVGGTIKAKEMLEVAKKRRHERSSSHTLEMPASERLNFSSSSPLTTSNPLGEIRQRLERYRESQSDILGRLHKLEQTEKERGELQEQINRLSSQWVQLKTQLQQERQERSQLQSKVSSLEAQLKQAQEERSQLNAGLEELKNANAGHNDWLLRLNEYVSYFSTQIEEIKQYLRANRKLNSSASSSSESNQAQIPTTSELQQIKQDRSRLEYQLNQTNDELESIKSQITQLITEKQAETTKEKSYLSWELFNLINQYNYNSAAILSRAIEVYETEESYQNRSTRNSQTVVLEKSSRGNYWLITEGKCNYLFPKSKIKITEFNYQTVRALFECHEYKVGESQNFQLLKPAEVLAMARGEKWQLVDRGVLLFLRAE